MERADGVRIEEELLSRGTQEQLYLSMRLAHLDVYHREKFNMPMMMDDVLVNFDPRQGPSNCRHPGKICRGDRLTNIVLYLSPTHGRPFSRQCNPISIGTDLGGRGRLQPLKTTSRFSENFAAVHSLEGVKMLSVNPLYLMKNR